MSLSVVHRKYILSNHQILFFHKNHENSTYHRRFITNASDSSYDKISIQKVFHRYKNNRKISWLETTFYNT